MQSEASSWAQEVATRLWALQTSFADDPPDQRKQYLIEEIKGSLQGVVMSKWPEHLNALAHRFPGPERIDGAPGNAAATPTEPVEKTVEELIEELLSRAIELTKEAKSELAARMESIGLTVGPDRGLSLPPELRGKLGLTPDQPLDEERLCKLLATLLEMVAAVSAMWVRSNDPNRQNYLGALRMLRDLRTSCREGPATCCSTKMTRSPAISNE